MPRSAIYILFILSPQLAFAGVNSSSITSMRRKVSAILFLLNTIGSAFPQIHDVHLQLCPSVMREPVCILPFLGASQLHWSLPGNELCPNSCTPRLSPFPVVGCPPLLSIYQACQSAVSDAEVVVAFCSVRARTAILHAIFRS